MDALKKVFESKNKDVRTFVVDHDCGLLKVSLQSSPALVTFVTAGYPTVEDSVSILLAMQEGGADIIELGVPFSDPMADGPAIQETNLVRLYSSSLSSSYSP